MVSHLFVNRTRKNIPVNERDVFEIIDSHLKKRGRPNAIVEVEVVGLRKIASLNTQYLGKKGPTDVLSFPLKRVPGEDNSLIGTIVLCSDIINLHAKDNGISYSQEFSLKLVHGVDHLLGRHHK